MRLLRRKRTDATREGITAAFDDFAARIAAAQRALLATIPTARTDGVPLAHAVAAFAERLDEAEAALPAWRDERVLHEWTRCEQALAEAKDEAARLEAEPEALGFEALNARVGDVLHPLETVADVERRLRRL